MTGFNKVMRFCNTLQDYESAKNQGTITDDLFVVILQDKLAKFKGQTFDWSENADLTALATKGELESLAEEIASNERVWAEALNDLNERINEIGTGGGGGGGTSDIVVDAALSTTSTNAIQNKAVANALNDKQDNIADLETIRTNAQKGATALQEEQYVGTVQAVDTGDIVDEVNVAYATEAYVNSKVNELLSANGYIIDSFIYQPPKVNMVVSADAITFDANPMVLTKEGKHIKLFPSDASVFSLPIVSYGIYYIDNAVIPDYTTWLSPHYLFSGDIKSVSLLNNINKDFFRNKVILCITTDIAQTYPIYNFGAIGHFYYEILFASIQNELVRIGGGVNVRSSFPEEPKYGDLLAKKCPKFYKKMKDKNSDVTVVITGTSLTQGNLYASIREDATTRPPLLHTNDLASALFDRLVLGWDGQQYRRYDHPSLIYTGANWEVTNNAIVNDNSLWDDRGVYKNGLTKTTTATNASVSIVVPSDAWQFNFIYRSDRQGGESIVTLNNNGLMEVFNGESWVEANGYRFSMLESDATETKGNTCYQKRLKMRCKNKNGGIDSIGSEKTLVISKIDEDSRFNVVGFEWSPREYMFTFINGARGAHEWGVDTYNNLEDYQDLDIWEFNPDLILTEVTVINWGASSDDGMNLDPLYCANCAKRAYFNEFSDDSKSIYEKSEHWQKCEVVFYGDVASSAYKGCWNEDGSPKFGIVSKAATNGSEIVYDNIGRVKTIYENYDAVDSYMMSKSEDYIYIPVLSTFIDVANKYYGSYPIAFAQSGTKGTSLSYDTTHLNDNGAALWALMIRPLFDIL